MACSVNDNCQFLQEAKIYRRLSISSKPLLGIIIVMHGQVYFYEKVILVLSLLCMDKFISMKWLFWYYHCYAWTSLFL